MKIYVSHASGYEELYPQLRKLKEFNFVFPHENKIENSRDVIKKCDALIADISVPSHGVGIEIGWADSFGIPIILIFKKGSKISSSLKFVSKKIIEYNDFQDMVKKIKNMLGEI